LTEDARFCQSCGTAVDESGALPERPEGSPASASPHVAAVGPSLPVDVRNMAMLCHLSSFAGVIVPFGNILGPLLVWLLIREHSPFIDDHGRESLNWQISATIYLIVSSLLVLVIVGIFLLPALFVFYLVVVIAATVRANSGEPYSYPLSIQFIRPLAPSGTSKEASRQG
jgi:uncharacterized Tic20 family protein